MENCRAELRNTWSWNVRRRRKDIVEDETDHNILGTLLVDLPPLEGEVLIEEVIKVPYQSTLTRVSRVGNRPAWAGRGLRMKVNLLIFKTKRQKML